MQGRLQPAARSHLALVTKPVRIAPSGALHQKAHRFLNLPLVGIAFFDHSHRNTVSAENNLRSMQRWESGQGCVDSLDYRIKIYRITIKTFYATYGHAAGEKSPPLVQARSRSGRGILGIQRQEHNFVALRLLQLLDCLVRERMPVPHRHKTPCFDPLAAKFAFQSSCLPLRIPPDGRTATDRRVVMLDFACPRSRDQLGQRFTPDAGQREINNVGIAKEVVKKRLNRFQRVGSTELKENYPHTP